MDLLDLFERSSEWTASKVRGAAGKLDEQTPCDEWTVRRLIDHLLWGLDMFASGPGGGTVAPPSGPPPELVGDDPASQYEEARKSAIHAYSQPGVLDSMLNNGAVPAAQMVAIMFADQLMHGWDLAKCTGQDVTMPPDLAAAALQVINGRIPDEARGPGKNFKAAVSVPDDASDQDKFVAYLGRNP